MSEATSLFEPQNSEPIPRWKVFGALCRLWSEIDEQPGRGAAKVDSVLCVFEFQMSGVNNQH